MLPENPIQTNSQQIYYQIKEVTPQDEEDLDKQILKQQEEKDLIQIRFELEVHDTVFGDIYCPSGFNINVINKQSQSEDSEEAKDPLSKKDDKEKYIKIDQLIQNDNQAKAKDPLTKEMQKETHKETNKQSQS
ncbi:MAG: hypothetical protein EZS28_006656 [Streblomastix strix]|uniref:Uncharacterized protein n=1 Tax=Streblomastix strix TaxID=222440 RepID=A0A5J4WUG9_9EUKA|nr:MAG: hypothetical protein EZS28_006656 [Streblomastix strix]